MPDAHEMMTPTDAHVDRPDPVGPDGFTRLAGDAAYDLRERVKDALLRAYFTQVAEHQWNALEMARRAGVAENERDAALAEVERLRGENQRHYAAFVGAEAELTRLKAAADLVGHEGACMVDPCDCWMTDLAPLLEDWSR